MRFRLATFIPLLLASGALGAPLAGKPDPANSDSLESTQGPYKFEPAPVWPREADEESPGSLEYTAGPYEFEPAPGWPRKVEKNHAPVVQQKANVFQSRDISSPGGVPA